MMRSLSRIETATTAPTTSSSAEYAAGGRSATKRNSSNAYKAMVEATVALPRNEVLGVTRFLTSSTANTIRV